MCDILQESCKDFFLSYNSLTSYLTNYDPKIREKIKDLRPVLQSFFFYSVAEPELFIFGSGSTVVPRLQRLRSTVFLYITVISPDIG